MLAGGTVMALTAAIFLLCAGAGWRPLRTAARLASRGGATHVLDKSPAIVAGPAVPDTAPAAAGLPFLPTTDSPAAQRALWQERLHRAQERLAAYRTWARYPPDSRPASEHPDRLQPAAPLIRVLPLAKTGGAGPEVRLQLLQDRVTLVGSESARLSVRCEDGTGALLPCAVQTAQVLPLHPTVGAASPTGPHPAAAAIRFGDDGRSGDEVAGDGTLGAMLQPARLGFGSYLGPLRVALTLRTPGQYALAARGQPDKDAKDKTDNDPEGAASQAAGEAFFDLWYTPEPPAVLTGQVHEELSDGSLQLYLGIDVRTPGQYALAARVDDARGKSFALLQWNEELAAGPQEVKLTVFGKLILDGAPAMPLRLRDIDGLLLRADADTEPDREYLPLLAGYIHTTGSYPLSEFSDKEWHSPERDRSEAALTSELEEAHHALVKLGQDAARPAAPASSPTPVSVPEGPSP